MKYVDWIGHQRAAGDYSQVEAYLVAPRVGPQAFSDEALDEVRAIRERSYVEPVRPYVRRVWAALTIVLFELERVGDGLTDLRMERLLPREQQ